MAIINDEQELVNEFVLEENLRGLFEACDVEGLGMISLEKVPTLTGTNVDVDQVTKLFEILRPYSIGHDLVNFEEFCNIFIEYMDDGGCLEESYLAETDDTNSYRKSNRFSSAYVFDAGIFNANLKRAFEKDDVTYSCHKQHPSDMQNSKARTRFTGNIPLVNTSSEGETDDSFDRKIAQSLAMAKPTVKDTQPFLARGTVPRSAVRRGSSFCRKESTTSTSTKILPLESIESPTSLDKMSPIFAPDDEFIISESSETEDVTTKLMESDSPSSGVESLKADVDDVDICPVSLARNQAEEKLKLLRLVHREEIISLEAEVNLERRDLMKKGEHFQEENDELAREVKKMKGILDLLNQEKLHLEEQVKQVQDSNDIQGASHVEVSWEDKEKELVETVQSLTNRVQRQDNELAEVKEENNMLRNQVSWQKEMKCNSKAFKTIMGNKKLVHMWDDPVDIRAKLGVVEEELEDEKLASVELKKYVEEVLSNVMTINPSMLEKN